MRIKVALRRYSRNNRCYERMVKEARRLAKVNNTPPFSVTGKPYPSSPRLTAAHRRSSRLMRAVPRRLQYITLLRRNGIRPEYRDQLIAAVRDNRPF